MSNIRVDVGYTIKDGTEIKFRSPVDCSAITGLIVYYPGADGNTTSKVFVLADAHGNNVGDIDHLFAENVVVKVILDVTTGMAFVQNADTNAYLEAQLASKAPAGYGLGEDYLPIVDKTGLDNWTNAGWCLYYDGVNPDSTLGVIGFVNSKGHNRSITSTLIQEAYQQDGYGVNNLTRVGGGGTWQPWEWVNPPMIPGAEYRTTERYDGKPVYTALVNCGNLPLSGMTETTWHKDEWTTTAHIFECDITYGDENGSTQGTLNGLGYEWRLANFNMIRILNPGGADYSGFTAIALIKYWKG